MPKRSRRLQVSSGIRKPSPEVSTRIRRDTFVAPAEGQDLQQVARGLAEFNQTFSNIAGDFLQRRREKEERRGRQAFLEAMESQDSYREAINEGVIPPGASPWFKLGVQNEAGKVAAQRFFSEFLAEKGPILQESTELEDFDEAAQEAMESYLEERVGEDNRTEAFDMGFQSRARALLEAERTRFARQIPEKIEQESYELLSAKTFDEVRFNYAKGMSVEQIASDLSAQLDEAVDVFGQPGASARQEAVVMGVIDAARRENNYELLEILDHMKAGPKDAENRPTVAGIPKYSELIEKAEDDIRADRQSRWRFQEAQRKARRTRREREITAEAISALEDDPTTDMKEFSDRLKANGSPQAAKDLYSIKEAFLNRDYQDDPDTVANTWINIRSIPKGDPGYVTQGHLNDLLASRRITPETWKEMSTAIEERDSAGGITETPLDSDYLDEAIGQLEDLFPRDRLGGFPTEVRPQWVAAKRWLMREWVRWTRTEEGQAAIENHDTQTLMDKAATLADQAFILKADSQRVRDASLPRIGLGEGLAPLNWRREPVMDKDNLLILEQELTEVAAGDRERLSDFSWNLLRAANVPVDEATDFVETQLELISQHQDPSETLNRARARHTGSGAQ